MGGHLRGLARSEKSARRHEETQGITTVINTLEIVKASWERDLIGVISVMTTVSSKKMDIDQYDQFQK